MTRRYTRHGIPAGPAYAATHRAFTRTSTRREPLDAERGPMPEMEADSDPERAADLARLRATVERVLGGLHPSYRVAWAAWLATGSMGAAADAVGRSRERGRQMVLTVASRVRWHYSAEGTDRDAAACRWEPLWSGSGWYIPRRDDGR